MYNYLFHYIVNILYSKGNIR
uniref:Uncharacterized protein n=1 Tax=Heterorhabditis bacteriophora TaxID=37862 RepID=A0A1I7WKI5_HETBA